MKNASVHPVKPLLIPTILCGGAGTRLWPLSRDAYPKQFLTLTGTESLFQATVRRLNGFKAEDVLLAQTPIVVCNEDHRFLVAEQIKKIGTRAAAIILEPMGRNTAPALTLAALQTDQTGEDSLLLVMPADQIVKDRDAFHRAIAAGIASALADAIVTFGIVPDRPETGYGYIQAQQSPSSVETAHSILRFVEKPDKATAEQYLKEGAYYWNSGIFMMKTSVWLRGNRSLPAGDSRREQKGV